MTYRHHEMIITVFSVNNVLLCVCVYVCVKSHCTYFIIFIPAFYITWCYCKSHHEKNFSHLLIYRNYNWFLYIDLASNDFANSNNLSISSFRFFTYTFLLAVNKFSFFLSNPCNFLLFFLPYCAGEALQYNIKACCQECEVFFFSNALLLQRWGIHK